MKRFTGIMTQASEGKREWLIGYRRFPYNIVEGKIETDMKYDELIEWLSLRYEKVTTFFKIDLFSIKENVVYFALREEDDFSFIIVKDVEINSENILIFEVDEYFKDVRGCIADVYYYLSKVLVPVHLKGEKITREIAGLGR